MQGKGQSERRESGKGGPGVRDGKGGPGLGKIIRQGRARVGERNQARKSQCNRRAMN